MLNSSLYHYVTGLTTPLPRVRNSDTVTIGTTETIGTADSDKSHKQLYLIVTGVTFVSGVAIVPVSLCHWINDTLTTRS